MKHKHTYITMSEAVVLSGYSRQHIYNLAEAGTIQRGPVGGRLGYSEQDLRAYRDRVRRLHKGDNHD